MAPPMSVEVAPSMFAALRDPRRRRTIGYEVDKRAHERENPHVPMGKIAA
jgi:hypothetical protein